MFTRDITHVCGQAKGLRKRCRYLQHYFYWPQWLLWQKNEELSYRTHYLPCMRLTFDVWFIRFYSNLFQLQKEFRKIVFFVVLGKIKQYYLMSIYFLQTFLCFILLFWCEFSFLEDNALVEDDDSGLIKLGQVLKYCVEIKQKQNNNIKIFSLYPFVFLDCCV